VQDSHRPTQNFNIVKQISVPHGNSILAPGNSSSLSSGFPTIPTAQSVLPTGVDTNQYGKESVGNLNVNFTKDPNLPLIDAISVRPPTSFIALNVDTENDGGGVLNIGFEKSHANVKKYDTTLWLEAFENSPEFTQLQYTQRILMEIPLAGGIVAFPHITTNTLTRKLFQT
jgi:hypothetical protein